MKATLKITVLVLLIVLTGCKEYTIKTKLKIYYQNGSTEIVTLKRSSDCIYKHALYNGCLYRQHYYYDHEYSGALRCGINYYRTISVEKTLKKTRKS